MTKKTAQDWNDARALAALLDAGADELLAVSDTEIAAALREAGFEGRNAVEAMRRLLDAGAADPPPPPASKSGARERSGLPREP